MNEKISVIYEKIKDLEVELEDEINCAGEKLVYTLEEKKILFEKSVVDYHKKLRKSFYRFIREASIVHALTAPFIYGMAAPLVLIDISVSIYQAVCFPVYGIKKVPRSDFIALDRHNLQYLNWFEKFNCAYCGYANGLAGYLREVSARTEAYWCPIKHARRVKNPHSQYHAFEEYGDAEGFRDRMKRINDERKSRRVV